MEYEAGAHGEEHRAGDDARPEPVLLGERAAELVADRGGSPDRGLYGCPPGGRPCLDADHASGPPCGPGKADGPAPKGRSDSVDGMTHRGRNPSDSHPNE
ncbi:hypothetical protein GCM10017687_85860 [Streptomyces echinatus]